MALNDIYRVVLNSTIENQPVSNVLHFKEVVAADTDPQAIAAGVTDDILTRVRSQILPLAADAWKVVNAICNRIHPSKGNTYTRYALTTDVGAESVDPVAELAAGVFKMETEEASKRGRGRIYFSGIPQDQTDSGTWISTDRDSWKTAWTNVVADIDAGTTGTLQLCVWSKADQTGYLVNNRSVNPQLATQRRRRPRLKGPSAAE